MSPARSCAVVLVALALAAACGHKGPPVPPLRRMPPGLADFGLAQRGEALEVSLTAPRASVDGVPFDRLEVEIFWGEGQVDLEKAGRTRKVRVDPGARLVESLPLPPQGTLVRAAARAIAGRARGQRTVIRSLKVQPVVSPPGDLALSLREEGVALEWTGEMPEPVAAEELTAAAGGRVPFSGPLQERPPAEGEGETGELGPPAVEEEARAEGEAPAAESTEDVPAEGKAPAVESTEDAPAEGEAPAVESTGDVAAEGEALAVESTEDAPAEGEAPAIESTRDALPEPRTHGFWVYRRVPPGVYRLPLNRVPQEERTFTDRAAPLGAHVCYVVRAVASADPVIESASSNEACLDVVDIVAPSAPTGLAAVPRGGELEIVWTPSPQSDLSGYRIYRATGDSEASLVGEVEAGTTSWTDADAVPGVLYLYTVTAVDKAGNESAPSGGAGGRKP